jgi:hypothetical protein
MLAPVFAFSTRHRRRRWPPRRGATLFLATDQSDEAKAAVEAAKVELPEGWRIQAIALAA